MYCLLIEIGLSQVGVMLDSLDMIAKDITVNM